MPFDDDYKELDDTKTARLKKQPNESIFTPKIKKISKEEFNKKASDLVDKSLDYKTRAASLSKIFKSVLDDKTISENKSNVSEQIEKDLISDMINLAIEINQDENEIEGMGSVGWIALILRTLLIQKQKINDLEYKLSIVEKSNNETSKVRIKV